MSTPIHSTLANEASRLFVPDRDLAFAESWLTRTAGSLSSLYNTLGEFVVHPMLEVPTKELLVAIEAKLKPPGTDWRKVGDAILSTLGCLPINEISTVQTDVRQGSAFWGPVMMLDHSQGSGRPALTHELTVYLHPLKVS